MKWSLPLLCVTLNHNLICYTVAGPRRATGSFLQSFPIPLLTLVVPMVAMAMMTMMSNSGTTVTSRTPTNVQVTVPDIDPTTQTAALPSKYRLINSCS